MLLMLWQGWLGEVSVFQGDRYNGGFEWCIGYSLELNYCSGFFFYGSFGRCGEFGGEVL